MNEPFTNKPNRDEEDIAQKLNSVASETQPNAQFVHDLESQLRTQYKPKLVRSLIWNELSPTLGWIALVIVIGFLLIWSIRSFVPNPQPAGGSTPNNFICPVTQANGTIPSGKIFPEYATNIPAGLPLFFGNDQLWTTIWPNGKIYMLSTDRLSDGSFEQKWAFYRVTHGTLTVEGHRLDAEALPLRPDYPGGYPDSYGDTGLQILGLIFPTTGCWEVTGHVGDASLTFITEVVFGVPTPTPEVTILESTATPAPERGSYAFRGAKLILKAPLPETPAEVHIYQVKKDLPVTADEARALANAFGIQGEIYTSPGLTDNSTDYVITDGKQSLQVHSAHYFTYTADTAKALNNFVNVSNPNAYSIIDQFLKSHGFDFPHQTVATNFFGGYIIQPLAPDRLAMGYEAFTPPMMHITLDETGNVLTMDTAMINVDAITNATYGIISAQEALDRLLNDNVLAGKTEFSSSSSGISTKEWKRVYPSNETMTLYGYASSIPALDSSQPPFIQIDGFTVSGNTTGMEALEQNSFVAATGKFVDHSGVNIFEIDSWKLSEFQQDGLVGTLHRENGQVLLTTDQEQLTIQPDLPADLPLPFENAFVVGVRKGSKIYEWSLIDDRMASNAGGGGGGGGGGLGFYQLNLSGTPVPFPPATAIPAQATIPAGAGTYTVQAGDTLVAIADRFGITVDELSQVNNLSDTNLIMVGQTLIIPGLQTQPSEQPVTDLRGNLLIVIHKKSDGTQSREYNFAVKKGGVSTSYQLQGSKLNELDAYQSIPILVSGTIKHNNGTSTLLMDSFKIPFPDLHIQILKGQQTVSQVNGQVLTLFTDESGKTYAQISPDGQPNNMTVGQVGDQVLLEALAVPDETFETYPALRVYSAAMAINPKNGQPVDFPLTANQPLIVDETSQPDLSGPSAQPNLIIDSVELSYFVSNPYYQVNDPMYSVRDTKYLQPVWHFHGHYESGGVYEAMIQALKEEYLKPEIAPGLGPG